MIPLRILLAHSFHRPGIDRWYHEIAAAAPPELEVRCISLTPNPPAARFEWPEVAARYSQRDPALFGVYAAVRAAAAEADVLLNYNGIHLHPDFLRELPTFNVFACFDDPESSAGLSEPVAAHYDGVFYGNIAAKFQYDNWGCRRAAWLPIFTAPSDVPPRSEEATLLAAERDVPIVLACERESPWRRRRLDALAAEFPEACCVGRNWVGGEIDDPALHRLYRRARIGWNVHNSTGPINRRTFALPAFGVLQLCDNKTGLGQIFRLGDESVGFDTIPEAIELTRYFLAHPTEAAEIACAGYRRFWRDYHATAVWRRIASQIKEWRA